MKKAVGYIRVSTVRQVKKSESIATQRDEIENYAKQN
jgi:site-specific DNA recombinase